MRISFGKCLVILICVILLAGLVYVDSMGEIEDTKIELSFALDDEIINAWQGEDAYYLFLPSYAELENVKLLSYATEFEILDKGAVVIRGGSLRGLAFDELLSCKTAATKEEFIFCIMRSAKLPTIFIETDSGSLSEMWADKNVEENAKMQIFDLDGTVLFKGGVKGIKGRGNYSFAHFQKKSMTLTLKEEISLLGLGSGEKYALLANASDPTLIRNEIARKMEEALETEFTNKGKYVDLYANGDYLGTYYLCEMMEIGAERIGITDLEATTERLYQKTNYASLPNYETEDKKAKLMDVNPSDITGGYLVEREFDQRYMEEYSQNPSGFKTQGNEYFVLKSPQYCSDEQIDYIKEYFDAVETAMLAKDGIHPETGLAYDTYIDVDSFVKKYLVEEVTKNYDGGVSSSYYYKDSDLVDGRLKAAPIWDCDMSMGSYLDWMAYYCEEPIGLTKLSLHNHASFWYKTLYEKEEVYDKICMYYKEKMVPYLESLLDGKIEEYKEYLMASATMNDIRWKVDLDNNPYYKDRDNSFKILKQYMTQRKEFLDEVWVEQISYATEIIEHEDGTIEFRYIKDDKKFN